MIDISDYNKADVLAALYNNSKSIGLVHLLYKEEDMTKLEAKNIIDAGQSYFDYLYGRVMKVVLKDDSFDPAMYDRDNGPGAARAAIDSIKQ